ncbi:MAG: AIDA repeat-containing protein [Desulfovibrio sp.]|nr:AIDA repeat-containing protein [Desulfovibrio sp.]
MLIISGRTFSRLNFNSQITLCAGGKLVNAQASGWADLTVSSGGTVLGISMSKTAEVRILGAGFVSGANVYSRSTLSVSSGGRASGTTAFRLGGVSVFSGGTASRTVLSGGYMRVFKGGVAPGVEILSCAAPTLASSGTLTFRIGDGSSSLYSGTGPGRLEVSAGGTATNVVQRSGGIFSVDVAPTTFVSGKNAYGRPLRLSGGKASGFILYATASQNVLKQGTAIETVVSSGGLQNVARGGLAAKTVLSKAGIQLVNGGGSASDTVLSGGTQTIFSGGRASSVRIDNGSQFVSSGGIVANVTVSAGTVKVARGGVLRSATISSGGVLYVDGKASCLVLRRGASFFTFSSCTIYGSNRIEAVKVADGELQLASGASLVISGGGTRPTLSVSVSTGMLSFIGNGAMLDSVSISKDTSMHFDVSKINTWTATALRLNNKNKQKVGTFSVSVVAQQQMGTYGIAFNLIQARNTPWTVKQGKNVLGTVRLNEAGFSKNGVTYRLTAAKDKISLTLSAKAGKTLKGTDAGETVKGTKDSDVFWGGRGNDDFRNGAGRDCAIYGKENWGRDTITKTAGTLALLFKDLKASDVTTSLSGTTMTVTKKADVKQTVTIAGWDEKRHSLVFGGTMKAVDAWIKAASPTTAQATAARNEVWKKAGLATA